MPKDLEYVVTKLEKIDKAWPELLDKSIENALKNKESSRELIDFYTTVKVAIWQHLSSNLEQIIKDVHKAASQLKSPPITRKAINAPSSALTVAMFIDDASPAAKVIMPSSKRRPESSNDLPALGQTSQLNDTIEKMFDYRQPQDLQIMLADFDTPRIIATLVSWHLVNAMQTNLTTLGVVECGKLYSRAVVRVIVEKQLGSKGRLTDYNALIKFLAKARTNKDKALPQLIDALIKSAQMGNPYTRAIDRQNVLIHKTISSSRAFIYYRK